MVEIIFLGTPPFTFNAKNRRPRTKKMISSMLRTPSTKFRNSKCDQDYFFCSQPPLVQK
jgi:hypothetical protein